LVNDSEFGVNTSTADIIIQEIVENYPITGQRNDSQGFITNFTAIKNSLSTISNSIEELSLDLITQLQDNDIDGFDIKNANLINNTITLSPMNDESVVVDYSIANFWPITLSNSGIYTIIVTNMPSNSNSGVLTVSITTSTQNTKVTFVSGDATVISLGPEDQPFSLPTGSPYFFKLWNDYTGDTPYIYVKKISQDLTSPITSNFVSGDKIYGSNATFTSSISLSNISYTTGSNNSVLVTDDSHYGNFGLIPNKITTVITGTIVSPAGGLTNKIAVLNTSGIHTGSKFWFIGTTTEYQVQSIVGTLITTTANYDIKYAQIDDNITFINNQYSNQPTVLTFSNTSTVDSSDYNLKGTVYADKNTLEVSYANPSNENNTLVINLATTVTNSEPNDLATIGLVHQLIPAGSIIMWTKSKTKIPYGWCLCNGSIAPNGIRTPDLRNKFILGADSDLNNIPSVTNSDNKQSYIGGTSTGVLLAHTHNGTANTYALLDPGHDHLSVGPNSNGDIANFADDFSGPYRQSPNQPNTWGFTSASTSTASQWVSSLEHTFIDQQRNRPSSSLGIELQTRITVKSTGTNSKYSNLPQYKSLYFIYKWLTADQG